jgi:hypothetical protein
MAKRDHEEAGVNAKLAPVVTNTSTNEDGIQQGEVQTTYSWTPKAFYRSVLFQMVLFGA